MHPSEFHWLLDAKTAEVDARNRASGKLTEQDYAELYEFAFGDFDARHVTR